MLTEESNPGGVVGLRRGAVGGALEGKGRAAAVGLVESGEDVIEAHGGMVCRRCFEVRASL
eukprot:CAMPEP_0204637900 /NCGR_PEP_ID=MMETSP0717-20131115/37741_1 /ASSEMBLY_ACC=CAM_ASM_000666 /TAXON_ID=230516 /ORGANISM="Chaetoceros curvisetus" /LENGTH=60 /DNA_ID=CAMNT_0051657449 /DNA_START=76 /DNA_END=258 /DNA_ORIENTATION=-